MHRKDGWQPPSTSITADVPRCTRQCGANVLDARPEHLEHLPLDELAGFIRRARIERRVGVVLGPQLPALRVVLARQPGEQGEPEVDAGGHPAAGDAVAVFDDSCLHRFRADEGQQIVIRPVGGGLVPLQQAGGAENQGAGADRGDVRRALAAAGHEVEDVRILNRGAGALESAGDEQDLELLRRLIKGRGGQDRNAAIADNGVPGLPQQLRGAPGATAKNCCGPIRSRTVIPGKTSMPMVAVAGGVVDSVCVTGRDASAGRMAARAAAEPRSVLTSRRFIVGSFRRHVIAPMSERK